MPAASIMASGSGHWAFQPLIDLLSASLWIDAAETASSLNYIVCCDDETALHGVRSFIPLEAMRIAADKRLVAQAFHRAGVAAPETRLVCAADEWRPLLASSSIRSWVLKYPTGCGGRGHRILTAASQIPAGWPTPCVLQKFIRLDRPEVYRLYAVGGELMGFNVRRYPAGVTASPWVAHSRGARYAFCERAPRDALRVGGDALRATGLLDSFGCVDLLNAPGGRWLALEVGTDGLFNYVDRDLGHPPTLDALNERLATAFWSKAGCAPPWGTNWRYR